MTQPRRVSGIERAFIGESGLTLLSGRSLIIDIPLHITQLEGSR